MSLLNQKALPNTPVCNVEETGWLKNKANKYAKKAMAKAEQIAVKKLGKDKVAKLKDDAKKLLSSSSSAKTTEKGTASTPKGDKAKLRM